MEDWGGLRCRRELYQMPGKAQQTHVRDMFSSVPGEDRVANNLPIQLTSFVGRERELSEARRLLLGSARLLTLVGPGGSGKTRLAIQVATEAAEEFSDGVYFVSLGAIGDPGLVASAIAESLGLQAASDRPLMERLVGRLRDREILVVLDNFEHLLDAASMVAELLKAADPARVMVTSRSPLHVSGEQQFRVPPLAVPDPSVGVTAAAVGSCESVQLFVERASAARPGFALRDTNARFLAEVACRLDGLPLAIELAAARVTVLPPETMLDRPERSLDMLVGGARDLPYRQRTLRATIAWSYELLSDDAQRLLAICSVFRGGADLEMIESFSEHTAPVGLPVVDVLQELTDQSLIHRVDGWHVPRFSMLETIREFAAERLAEMPDAARIRECHAALFLTLAEDANRLITGPEEKQWLQRLDVEHNNIRAAIDWYRQASPPAALRLGAAMAGFWSRRGHFSEGRRRLRSLLDLVPDETLTRVRALNGAAWLACDQGDHPQAAQLVAESVALSRKLNDLEGEGAALVCSARIKVGSFRATEAGADVDQAVMLLRAANDLPGIALAMMFSGLAAQFTDRFDAAAEHYEQGVALCREHGFHWLFGRLSQLLGITRLDLGNLDEARRALEEGFRSVLDVGDRWVVPIGLAGFAGLAHQTGRPRSALRLAGAAVAYSQANEFSIPTPFEAKLEGWIAPARKDLGAKAKAIYVQGKDMGLEVAAAVALSNDPDEAWRAGPGPTLTPREVEVAGLVARGLTNRDVAAQLYISVRTVDAHVEHIFTKLGFRSRSQLVAWAHETQLVTRSVAAVGTSTDAGARPVHKV